MPRRTRLGSGSVCTGLAGTSKQPHAREYSLPNDELPEDAVAAGYGIAALDRALELVVTMTRLGPASLTRLALETGCTRANAFRILHTLQAHGLVAQDGPRGAWRLGPGWVGLARAAWRQAALQRAASPIMAALSNSFGEPVILAWRDGEQSEIMAVEAGACAVRPYTAPGERWPLHAGPGRLLLAYAPDRVQRAVLAGRLLRMASATRLEPGWLAADLPRIRARAWLITTDEIVEGTTTVTVGVADRHGGVVAALSVASASLRLRPPRPHTLLTPLVAAAEAIAAAWR